MAKLRFVHAADTHLGFSTYQRLVPEGEPYTGLNQREADVYTAWHALIEATLKLRPDLFVHAGDLFDSVRPSNRALHEAIYGLRRLTAANIPVVLIAGNHETPRLRETGHVFRLLENFEGLHPVYQGPPETLHLPSLTELNLVCVPHSHQRMEAHIQEAVPDEEYKNNLLVLHGTITGLDLPSRELNQALRGSGVLKPTWDYIALGHYHAYTRVEANAYYCGSIERFSFAEAGQPKGFALVELPGPRVTHQPLPVREFVDLPWLDVQERLRVGPTAPRARTPADQVQPTLETYSGAEGVGPDRGSKAPSADHTAPTGRLDLNALLQEALSACGPKGKVIRQRVLHCPLELYRLVDHTTLRRLASEAVHYRPQFELMRAGEPFQAPSMAIGALEQEFTSYLASQPLEGLDRQRLERLGQAYLKGGGDGT